jgi:hypothetical protein
MTKRKKSPARTKKFQIDLTMQRWSKNQYYEGPLTTKIKEIITSAVTYPDLRVTSIKRVDPHIVRVIAVGTNRDKTINEYIEDITLNFSDLAADSWMEGNIEIEDGTEDELGLELYAVRRL